MEAGGWILSHMAESPVGHTPALRVVSLCPCRARARVLQCDCVTWAFATKIYISHLDRWAVLLCCTMHCAVMWCSSVLVPQANTTYLAGSMYLVDLLVC